MKIPVHVHENNTIPFSTCWLSPAGFHLLASFSHLLALNHVQLDLVLKHKTHEKRACCMCDTCNTATIVLPLSSFAKISINLMQWKRCLSPSHWYLLVFLTTSLMTRTCRTHSVFKSQFVIASKSMMNSSMCSSAVHSYQMYFQ